MVAKLITSLLKNERKSWALSQRKFAAELSVTNQTISNWENGDFDPDEKTLFDISRNGTTPRARKLALSCLRLRYPDFQIIRKEKTPLPVTPFDELEAA